MKKIIKACCLTFILSAVCFGQTTTGDEYKKNEFYVGYTNQQSDNFSGRTSHGVGASYTRNVSRPTRETFRVSSESKAIFPPSLTKIHSRSRLWFRLTMYPRSAMTKKARATIF